MAGSHRKKKPEDTPKPKKVVGRVTMPKKLEVDNFRVPGYIKKEDKK